MPNLPTFSNGEKLSSVRTKLNNTIEAVNTEFYTKAEIDSKVTTEATGTVGASTDFKTLATGRYYVTEGFIGAPSLPNNGSYVGLMDVIDDYDGSSNGRLVRYYTEAGLYYIRKLTGGWESDWAHSSSSSGGSGFTQAEADKLYIKENGGGTVRTGTLDFKPGTALRADLTDDNGDYRDTAEVLKVTGGNNGQIEIGSSKANATIFASSHVDLKNPRSSSVQENVNGALTRKDYVDGNFIKNSGVQTLNGEFNVASPDNKIRIINAAPGGSYIQAGTTSGGHLNVTAINDNDLDSFKVSLKDPKNLTINADSVALSKDTLLVIDRFSDLGIEDDDLSGKDLNGCINFLRQKSEEYANKIGHGSDRPRKIKFFMRKGANLPNLTSAMIPSEIANGQNLFIEVSAQTNAYAVNMTEIGTAKLWYLSGMSTDTKSLSDWKKLDIDQHPSGGGNYLTEADANQKYVKAFGDTEIQGHLKFGEASSIQMKSFNQSGQPLNYISVASASSDNGITRFNVGNPVARTFIQTKDYVWGVNENHVEGALAWSRDTPLVINSLNDINASDADFNGKDLQGAIEALYAKTTTYSDSIGHGQNNLRIIRFGWDFGQLPNIEAAILPTDAKKSGERILLEVQASGGDYNATINALRNDKVWVMAGMVSVDAVLSDWLLVERDLLKTSGGTLSGDLTVNAKVSSEALDIKSNANMGISIQSGADFVQLVPLDVDGSEIPDKRLYFDKTSGHWKVGNTVIQTQ